MNIRPAKIEDLDQCHKLISVPELICPDGDYLSKEFLKNYLDEDYFFVAEKDGEIIGTIHGESMKGEVVMLWMIAVDESVRGEGIGNLLIEFFEKKMRGLGKKYVVLYGTASNEKTLKFYINRGYDRGSNVVEFVKNL